MRGSLSFVVWTSSCLVGASRMASGIIPRAVSEKRRFWRQVVDGHAGSGLTVFDWCRRRKVSQSAFYAWKRKLAPKASGPAGSGPRFAQLEVSDAIESQTGSSPRFAQLVVSDAGVGQMRPAPGNGVIAIEFDDARVEVPAGFDPATLRVVLDALRQPPSAPASSQSTSQLTPRSRSQVTSKSPSQLTSQSPSHSPSVSSSLLQSPASRRGVRSC